MGRIRRSGLESPADILFMHSQASGSGRWAPAPECPLKPDSMSVFGTLGSRISVLVLQRGSITAGLAGREGGWILSDRWRDGARTAFRIQWAVDAGNGNLVVLCGRETRLPFCTSA